MYIEKSKQDPWGIRFYGITLCEFEKISNMTDLPMCYRSDLMCICYEWFQYAKTDSGEFFKYLCNVHGEGVWKNKRREVQFEDGTRMVIGRINNMRDCVFLQK